MTKSHGIGRNSGRTSPQWALLEPLHIGTPEAPYLDRLRLFQTPWFGLYLHRIHRPDIDPDPHDHPWWFASVVLCGGYTELVWPDKTTRGGSGTTRCRIRKRWSLRHLNRKAAHMITETDGLLWTLVLTGPRRSTWGFWTPDGFVRWQDYVNSPEDAPGGEPW